MSVTVRTPTATAVAGVSRVVLTLPAGSAVGDFALLFLSQQYQAIIPSGWGVLQGFTSGSTWNGQVFNNYLRQSDITAGSVTVDFAGSYDTVAVLVTAGGSGKVSYRAVNSNRSTGGGRVDGNNIVFGDTGLYFGSNNAADTCSANRGTSLWQGNDGTAGAGCLFTEVYNSTNSNPTVLFTYTTSSAINYQALIYLYDSPLPSDLVQVADASSATNLTGTFGTGPSAVLQTLSTTFGTANTSGNTLVASATGFVAGTNQAKLGPDVTLNYSAGGSLPATTYYVRAALIGPGGHLTNPGNEAILAVPANNLLTVIVRDNPTGNSGANIYISTATGTETKQNTSPVTPGTTWTEPTSGLISGAAMPIGIYDTAGNTWKIAASVDATSSSSLYGDNPLLLAYAGNCAGGSNTVTVLMLLEDTNPFTGYPGEIDLIVAEFSHIPNPTVQSSATFQQQTSTGDLSFTLLDSSSNLITTDFGPQTGNDAVIADLFSPSDNSDNWVTTLTGNNPSPPTNTPTLTGGAYNLVDWITSPNGMQLWLWRAGPVVSFIFPSMWINT